MIACLNNHLQVARLLLQHGASKTAVDTSGKTAFHYVKPGAVNAGLRKLVKP
jgi:ankyrin repeat protein